MVFQSIKYKIFSEGACLQTSLGTCTLSAKLVLAVHVVLAAYFENSAVSFKLSDNPV